MSRGPQPLTWALGALAAAAVALWALDPGGGDAREAVVSVRTGATRALPALAAADPGAATVRIERPKEPAVELRPSARGGHDLWIDGALAGPADPEAFEGLWDDLRLATRRRAPGSGALATSGAGVLEVEAPGLRARLELGAPTADGGVGATVDGERAVIDGELLEQVRAPARAWVLRRLLPLAAREVVRLRVHPATRASGEEAAPVDLLREGAGFWRVAGGGDALAGAILADAAVAAWLDRRLSARLVELAPPPTEEAEAALPWLEVWPAGGGDPLAVERVGACPKERARVRRGEGWSGCIDEALLGLVPLAELVEPRLLPVPYEGLLTLGQPEGWTLRRRAGGWVALHPGQAPTEVSEPEVARWVAALREARVAPEPAVGPPGGGVAADGRTLALGWGEGETLTITCREGESGAVCRRGEGPWLRVHGDLPDVIVRPEALQDRRLLRLRPEEVVAVELLPAPGSGGVRQSVHLDLGVWRLGAPRHPAGDAALDEVRLEALLARLGALRAEPADVAGAAPVRTLRVERARADDVEVTLLGGCRVSVGGRGGKLDEEACATLGGDLLYADPLRAALRRARSVEVPVGETTVRVRRPPGGAAAVVGDLETDTGAWEVDGGADAGPALAILRDLAGARAVGIEAGPPPGPPRLRVTAVDDTGAHTLELGRGWARVGDTPWIYRLHPRPAAPAAPGR